MKTCLVTSIVCSTLIFAAGFASADDYQNDLADLVEYYDNHPDDDGYVIMIDDDGAGDFQYVFMEVDNAGIIDVANEFDSAGRHEGIDPSSYGQPMGDYIGSRGLSVQGGTGSCMFEVYCNTNGPGGL